MWCAMQYAETEVVNCWISCIIKIKIIRSQRGTVFDENNICIKYKIRHLESKMLRAKPKSLFFQYCALYIHTAICLQLFIMLCARPAVMLSGAAASPLATRTPQRRPAVGRRLRCAAAAGSLEAAPLTALAPGVAALLPSSPGMHACIRAPGSIIES